MNTSFDPSTVFTPMFFFIQGATLLVWFALVVIAIRKAIKNTSGSATPLWILLVFFVPFLGAVTTIACVKRGNS